MSKTRAGKAAADAAEGGPVKATTRKASVVAGNPEPGSGRRAPAPHKPKFPVVAIGASAGGLAALKQLFKHVPEDPGVAFVIVVHLSPDHESHLAEVLQPVVRMPVQQVKRTVKLKANHVYVIPPAANLDAIDTHLRLSRLEAERQRRAPIDHFFRTLAATHDGKAIAVILTGTGADGTLGVREIKEHGGVCIVQDPNEAEFDGMPQSAIGTGIVDRVLPIAEMPAAILAIAHTRPRLPEVEEGDDFSRAQRSLLQEVLAQVHARTGRDFSRYKRPTIVRRVERRMQLAHLEELQDYVELLRRDALEARELGDDLLITVTSFFRDADVYEELETNVIPRLFDGKSADADLRVWTVGCATGEEAYSMAMLLLEEEARRKTGCRLQIFASDLHETSLQRARDGFYPGDIETDVDPRRLKRFFTKVDGGYRVRKELRDIVVFAPHNLLSDPPFSRLDLVTCRNLLIYLQRNVQREVIELFHYALQPEGFLLLGTSETIENSDLFSVEHKRCCVYRKRNVPAPEPRLPVFPRAPANGGVRGLGEEPGRPVPYESVFHRMLEHFGPPSALVTPEDKVVHYSDRAGRYFRNPRGKPTDNVFQLIREELQAELRGVLRSARETRTSAGSEPVAMSFDGVPAYVTLRVYAPLSAHGDGCSLLVFEEQREVRATSASPREQSPRDVLVRQLEEENQRLEQRLQSTAEEYESSREEARSSSEEMQSTNEELRSAMEELETSKEELQSINEELQTVNQENRHKVAELSQLSNDLQNLMAATDIATLFLDRDLRILRFTPTVEQLFRVRMADRGRPLRDLTNRLVHDDLTADASKVLQTLVPIERELRDENGRWYLTNIRPYRSTDDQIQGVVITFVDISRRKQVEEALVRSEQQLAGELAASQRLHQLGELLIRQDDLDGFYHEVLDTAISIMRAHGASLQLLDAHPDATDILRLVAWQGFHPRSAQFWKKANAPSRSTGAARHGDQVVVADVEAAAGIDAGDLAELRRSGLRAMQTTLLRSRAGQLLGAISTHWREPHEPAAGELQSFGLLVRQVADLIEQKRSADALRTSEQRLRRMMNVAGVGVAIFDRAGMLVDANDAFRDMTSGDEGSDDAQLTWESVVPPAHAPLARQRWTELVRAGRIGPLEVEYVHDDGTCWAIMTGAALGDGSFATYWIDISDWKEAESKLREHERQFRTLVEQIENYAIFMVDLDGRATSWNEGVRRVLGFEEREFLGADVAPRIFTPEDVAAGVPQAELEEAERTGSASDDRWMRRKDGSRFWATGMTTALHDRDGRHLGYMKVMRDQTDRKLLEDEQQRLADRLAEANRRKDEFIATLAHEIRNPLAPIRTGAALLRNRDIDRSVIRRTLEMIERQSRQLVRLMDDLLDVSRITRGKLDLRTRRTQLDEIVGAAVEAVRPAIDDAGQVMDVVLPAEPVTVVADPHRLTQVISNLLHNATKYTGRGGNIRLAVTREDTDVVVEVSDSGRGIDVALLDHVFDMFTQGEQPGTGSGLGIGLTLVKSIVELHGGSVDISSAGTGKGTTVRVRLPVAAEPEAEADSELPAGAPWEPVSGLRILVVDDRKDAADTLTNLLHTFGNETRAVYHGSRVAEIGEAFRPDAVLLDIGMPDMDGYAVAREIRSRPWGENVLLLAVTGWGQAEDRKRTREAGFDHHLVKPVDIAHLCNVLTRVRG